jgi:hypothetical protein
VLLPVLVQARAVVRVGPALQQVEPRWLLSRCRDGVPEVIALLDQYEQDSIACGSQ